MAVEVVVALPSCTLLAAAGAVDIPPLLLLLLLHHDLQLGHAAVPLEPADALVLHTPVGACCQL
jgi:hypothetical protein